MSALNAKDMATMESLIADDFVDNDAKPGMAPGRQGMIDMMGMFVGAFPDLNVVVDHWVAEGTSCGNHDHEGDSNRGVHGNASFW